MVGKLHARALVTPRPRSPSASSLLVRAVGGAHNDVAQCAANDEFDSPVVPVSAGPAVGELLSLVAAVPMRKFFFALTIVVIGVLAWIAVSPSGDARARAEREHGIALPISATNIQHRGDASRGFLDRGAATLFEMSTNDLASFVSLLRINSRSGPSIASGDPTANGYNVWPQGSATFVPGNNQYGGFRRSWRGEAVPVEMLSCSSPKGDWLHVELWRLEGSSMLLKMYTDWN